MNTGGPSLAAHTRRETAHLAVVCESGSFAEQNLSAVAADVERVFGKILKALKIPSEAMLRPHRGPRSLRGASAARRPTASRNDGAATSDLTADTVTVGYGPTGPVRPGDTWRLWCCTA